MGKRHPDYSDEVLKLRDQLCLDKVQSWRSDLVDRYVKFLRAHNVQVEVAPLKQWGPGSAELTEALLREKGYG